MLVVQAVAVVQRAVRGEKPAEMMLQLGFGDLLLTDSFPVSMSGSQHGCSQIDPIT